MSRKILKIGTDVLTINDKLVSVREDYPFWKVNLDTSEQYWNAFDNTNTSTPYPLDITNVGSFVGLGFLGFVTCDGINHYSIPTSDTTIKKFNSDTGAISYIGSLSGTNKYSSAIPVGQFIYYIPSSSASVLKLDTTNDTFTFLGSFAGNLKWGRAILLPDGRIFAPKYTATTHFILDTVDDNVTLQSATNVGSSDQYEAGTWYYNGFIYGVRGLGGNSGRIIKINATTLVETIANVGAGSTLYLGSQTYKNLTFLGSSGSTSMAVWNSDTDTYSFISTPAGAIGSSTIRYGSDGWIYMLCSPLLGANIRINPKNFTVETVSKNANAAGSFYIATVCGTNGKIYAFSGQDGNLIQILNPTTSENINPNQLLNRNINKV